MRAFFLTCAGVLCLALTTARGDAPPVSSGPSTQPASRPAPGDTTPVVKGTIVATIELEGHLEPVDPFEVRVRPESYQGDLKVKSVAPHGAAVKRGEILLAVDPTNLQRQLAEADNALIAARAAMTKAEADNYLGEQADALALQQARDELATAEGALKWWEDVDGKQMLTSAELSVRNARNNVEDQNDELDQLKKMYKTEDLTNATSEIVIKRAVRSLEMQKVMQMMVEWREAKTKNFDYNVSRQRFVFGVEQEKQQLAQLQAQQELQKVQRKTAVTTARLALDKAEVKVNELKSDQDAFTITAPFDGIVYYGQLSNGAWQNGGPKAVRVGEKVAAGQVLMTFVQPAKLRVAADIPEAKLNWIKPGSEARIVPVALPEAATTGACAEIAPCGAPRDGGQAFTARFNPQNLDPRLLSAMKVVVRVDAGTASDVLVVPSNAVSMARVRVRDSDGKNVWRDVVVGKSDGELVEIKSGLNEGDLVVTKAGK